MEKELSSRTINMCTKLRLLKCYVRSNLLYGCESWTISKRMESQLEAGEMWFLERMLHIAWTDKVSNDQVLQRANTSRNLLKVIVSRQIRFVAHVMRKNKLEAVALTGMIEGKRVRGRQRKMFMDWISTACGDKWNINKILKICQDRNEHLLIANVKSLTRHLYQIGYITHLLFTC